MSMRFHGLVAILLNLLVCISALAVDCNVDTIKVEKKLATSLEYINYVTSNNRSGHDLTNSYYTASVCYAMLGKYDSAVYYLPKNYTSLVNLNDIFFDDCRAENSWHKISKLIISDFKSKHDDLKNPDLTIELMLLSGREQSLLWYGFYLVKGTSCNKLKLAHQEHIRKAKQILESLKNKDYPTVNDIGKAGMKSLFLLIQHADYNLANQKLFKLKMEEAIKKQSYTDTLLIRQLAFLTDRVLVNEKKLQEYGTQFDESSNLLPIRDATNVNERRAHVFLDPISLY